MKYNIYAACISILCLLTIYSCSKKSVIDPSHPVTPDKPVLIVTADTAITLPIDSLTLYGKAAIQSGTIKSYLWSQISGPASAVFRTPASATTIVTKLIAGKYAFQFTVTSSDGSTGKDTVEVTINAPTITPAPTTDTLSVSPSNNPGEFNLGVWDGADWSSALSIEEPLSAWTKDGAPTLLRNLLKFDLSSIPQNAKIISANLYLYSDPNPENGDLVNANSGTNNSVLIQQVDSTWDPSTLNWFNQPKGLTANEVIIPHTPLSFLDVNVDVSAIVGAMISTNSNYGFLLQLQNEVEYTSRIFCSSYYSDVTKHPKLVVIYQKQ